MNKTIKPAMPTAKNLAVFSLFLCRMAFANAALAFAVAAAVTVAFGMIEILVEKGRLMPLQSNMERDLDIRR